ncbi:hypothetical protein J6590_094366 [Homalodisca vitripennis]|nr:hypothetical protein J6590_094366 [Homalodisca vitripennis]
MELLVIKPAGPGLEDQTLTPTGVSQTLSRVSQTQTPVLTSLNPQLSGLDDGYGSSNSSPHSSVYSSQEIANDAVNVEVDWRTICLESTESYRGVTGIKVQKAHPSSTVSGQYRSSVAGPFVTVIIWSVWKACLQLCLGSKSAKTRMAFFCRVRTLLRFPTEEPPQTASPYLK